jgi:hypothetical protein
MGTEAVLILRAYSHQAAATRKEEVSVFTVAMANRLL